MDTGVEYKKVHYRLSQAIVYPLYNIISMKIPILTTDWNGDSRMLLWPMP